MLVKLSCLLQPLFLQRKTFSFITDEFRSCVVSGFGLTGYKLFSSRTLLYSVAKDTVLQFVLDSV